MTFFFLEGVPSGSNSAEHPAWGKNDPPNAVNAFHWYDGFALFTKQFRPWFTINPENSRFILGRKNVQAFFTGCLARGIKWSQERMGGMPCLLGEFGLAFDMNNRRAFSDGDYSLHEQALSMYYNAIDENLLHSTIWNYTADNTNKSGDDWNDEDLSIFSEGKERAAAGWKRPYPMAAAGTLLSFKWDCKRGIFRCRFSADGSIAAPSIVYLPADRFGPSLHIAVTAEGGAANLRFEYSQDEQRLLVYNDGYSGNAEIVAFS